MGSSTTPCIVSDWVSSTYKQVLLYPTYKTGFTVPTYKTGFTVPHI